MDRRATHFIGLLIAALIVVVAAPIAQGGNGGSARVSDPVRAAYTAAWQAYRGLPGGPPALVVPDPVRAAYTAAWQAYRGLPGGPPAKVSDPVRAAYTAAWQAYRGLPGGPPLSNGSSSPQPKTHATPVAASGSAAFDWGDAGIGAAGMLGIMLLAGIGAVLTLARSHRRQTRHV